MKKLQEKPLEVKNTRCSIFSTSKTSFARGDIQNANMVYQALELSDDGTFIPYIRDNRAYVFNIDDLLSKLKTPEEQTSSIDVMTATEKSTAEATAIAEEVRND